MCYPYGIKTLHRLAFSTDVLSLWDMNPGVDLLSFYRCFIPTGIATLRRLFLSTHILSLWDSATEVLSLPG
jgi:hypothetical protein